jgi:hypothetical protein
MQIEYIETNCSYLDVRLTFRTAASSGLVEVCNENNTWSIACSNTISEDEIGVICRQLGFNGADVNQFTKRLIRDEKPRLSEFTRECIGNETTLLDCRDGGEVRSVSDPPCDVQAGVLCGGIFL